MKKKRWISLILCFVMAFSLTAAPLVPASAKAVEDVQRTEEAQKEQELQTVEEIEAAKASDVEITAADVPCQTVEWGLEEEPKARAASSGDGKTHQMVLVLDVSGSMSGTPMTELKKACNNFVDDILTEDPAAQIAIVTYESNVTVNTFSGSYFTSNRGSLRKAINSLRALGGTAMNAGLAKADEILQGSGSADEKYIIQMADGSPNAGKGYSGAGAKYPSNRYASEVYNTFRGINNDYFIYSLGFFHDLSESGKAFPAQFMNDIQNQAYYEVLDADELYFSFEKIAQNISSDQLTLNKSSLTLSKGDSDTLAVSFTNSYTSDDKTVTWGTSDPSVATVNGSGEVTAVGEGTCTITAEAGGFKIECPVTVTPAVVKLAEMKRIVIYENQNGQDQSESKYVLSSGAVVTYNGTEYKANSLGSVSFPMPDSGEVSVSSAEHVTRVFSVEQLENTDTVYLQRVSDNPTVNAIWVDGEDALVEEHEISLTKDSATSIAVEVDWGNSSYGGISLVQEAQTTAFSGSALSLVLKNQYDVSKDLYVLVTDAAGHSVKQKINFAVTDIDALDGASLSFGDKISLSLPKDWPWIGGQDISLNLDTLEAIPLEVSVDNGKIIWTVGIDVAKYTKTNKKVTNHNTKNSLTAIKRERKTAFDMIKEGVKDFKDKKDYKEGVNAVKNIKSKYKTAMNFRKGKYVIDMDFTVLGYGEGYIDTNGQYQWLEGGVILNPSGSVSWDGQFAIGPVPMYWEAAISAEIAAKLALLQSKAGKDFIPEGELGLTVKVNAGAGVGVNSVATVGGGATVRLAPSATFYFDKKNYYKAEAGISIYLKAKLGILEWRYDTPEKKATIDNSAKSARAAASGDGAQDGPTESIYNTDEYTVQDLSYLLKTAKSRSMGNEEILYGTMDTEHYASIARIFHANSYEETNPQIVSLEGNTRLAVWVDCETADINDIQLYYSYYDGAAWTQPAVISEDGTADFSPSVCVSNKKAYIVWQNAEAAFDAADQNLNAAKIAKNMGICAAEFKPASQTFTVKALTQPDNVLDMQPAISASGNTVTVAWVQNTDNEWFGAGNNNNILTSSFDGSAWSDAAPAAEKLTPVTSLAVDCQGEKRNIAYTTDTDGDLNTTEDHELYVNGKKVTENDAAEGSVTFVNHVLYWLSGAALMQTDDMNDFAAKQVLSDHVGIISGKYQIAEDGENKAVLYTVPENAGSEIYGAFWDADRGSWGEPIRLTDCGSNITLFGGVWTNDVLQLLCNSVSVNASETGEITEETYGEANLILLDYSKPVSMDIVDCVYNDAEIIVDSALPIYLTVKNSGMRTVNGVRVQIADETGAVMEEVDFNQTILSGETAELEMNYQVKKSDIGKTYTVSCTPLKTKAYRNGENGTIDFSYEAINLSSLSWGFSDSEHALIYGYAENLGYHDLKDVRVDLYKNSADGTQQESMTLGLVASMSSSNIKFSIPFEEGTLYYVSLSAKLEDGTELLDSDYIYLKESKSVSGRVLQGLSVSNVKNSYKQGEALDLRGLLVTAKYNDGTTSDVSKDVSVDLSKVNMNVPGTYQIVISYPDGGGFKETFEITVTGDNKTQANPNGGDANNGAVNAAANFRLNAKTRTAAYTNAANQTAAAVKIPSSITVWGITYTVTSIASGAFQNNTVLKKVELPASLTSIGAKAFYGCKKLTKITIPAKVKSIGKAAFQNCKKLKSITIKTQKLKAKTVGAKAFQKIYAKAVFKLPKKQKALYKKILLKKGATRKMKFK